MMKRNRGRFTTILAVSGEKLPGSVVFPPTAAPLSPRCICRRQRSSITPGTLRVPWAVFFCTYKKQQAPQKRYLLFWQGQKDLVSPAGSVGASAYFVCRGLRRRPAPLGTRFWSGCLTAKIRLITAFSSLLLQIFNKTKCF